MAGRHLKQLVILRCMQLTDATSAVIADCGVDGVKVDVQATVGLMGSKLGGGPAMTRKYHQSLESSVQAAFPGNHCINCMCHSTENLYRYAWFTISLCLVCW